MITKSLKSILTRRPLLGFFFLSFAISWVLWIPLLYGHFKYGWTSWEGDSWTNIRTMLGILGSLGPALSAIILTYNLEGKAGVRLLLKRLLLWRGEYSLVAHRILFLVVNCLNTIIHVTIVAF